MSANEQLTIEMRENLRPFCGGHFIQFCQLKIGICQFGLSAHKYWRAGSTSELSETLHKSNKKSTLPLEKWKIKSYKCRDIYLAAFFYNIHFIGHQWIQSHCIDSISNMEERWSSWWWLVVVVASKVAASASQLVLE